MSDELEDTLGRLLHQAQLGLLLAQEVPGEVAAAVEQRASRGGWLGAHPALVTNEEVFARARVWVRAGAAAWDSVKAGLAEQIVQTLDATVERVGRWWRYGQHLHDLAGTAGKVAAGTGLLAQVRELLTDGFEGVALEDRQIEDLARALRAAGARDVLVELAGIVPSIGARHGWVTWQQALHPPAVPPQT